MKIIDETCDFFEKKWNEVSNKSESTEMNIFETRIYILKNFETKLNNSFLSRSIKLLGTNKYANKMFRKIADDGITI